MLSATPIHGTNEKKVVSIRFKPAGGGDVFLVERVGHPTPESWVTLLFRNRRLGRSMAANDAKAVQSAKSDASLVRSVPHVDDCG
jgi:hypothetical protein